MSLLPRIPGRPNIWDERPSPPRDNELVAFLKKLSGFSDEPIQDADGYWTIGYGQRLNDTPGGPRPFATISEPFADEMLRLQVAQDAGPSPTESGSADASDNDQPTAPPPPKMEEIVVTAPAEAGLVQLPQDLPDEFRTYGKPGGGVSQYGTPATIHAIGEAASRWRAAGQSPFYVGDMSKSDGSPYRPHSPTGGHTKGDTADVRPIRKDGKNLDVDYRSPDYDREATQKLVDTFRATGARQILFNDPQIRGVTYQDGHNNHLHIRIDPNYRRPPR